MSKEDDDKINIKNAENDSSPPENESKNAENANAENAENANAENAENANAENANAENAENAENAGQAPNIQQQEIYDFEGELPNPIRVPEPTITIPRPGASESYKKTYIEGFKEAYRKAYEDGFRKGFNSFVPPKELYSVDVKSQLKNPNTTSEEEEEETEEDAEEETQEEEEEEEETNQKGGFKQDLIVEPTLDDIQEPDEDEIVDVPVEDFI
jgi:hypothetical protein